MAMEPADGCLTSSAPWCERFVSFVANLPLAQRPRGYGSTLRTKHAIVCAVGDKLMKADDFCHSKARGLRCHASCFVNRMTRKFHLTPGPCATDVDY